MKSKELPQVVVVTGAGAGLGRAIALEFARRGASIGLISRDQGRLESALRDVEEAGGRGIVLPTDVADASQVDDAMLKVEERYGPVDVWVNNAMTSVFSPFKDMTADEFRRVNDVTYLGYVYGTMAALRSMQPRNKGTIVQVGSALAYRSIPLQSAYCGAKHAIVGFTDSLRSELLHDGSNVNLTVVHMPALNTPQFSWVLSRLPRKPQPVPPIFQPEVGAEAVYWASRHHPRELLVGGPTMQSVLVQKLIPGLLDRYLARVGYQAQQYDGEPDPERPNNLWEAVEGPFAAHGDFDERASSRSAQLWLTTHRSWIAAAGAGLIAATVTARRMTAS